MTIVCPVCQTEHVANTLFCSECGEYLPDEEIRETDPVGEDEIGLVGLKTEGSNKNLTPGEKIEPGVIRLKVKSDTDREFEILLDKAIYVGRLDPASNALPEIDLTTVDDGVNRSISRRHARILKIDNRIVIEDLGSTNGSYVNGQKLTPYLPRPLHNGDILQLGKVMLTVRLSIDSHIKRELGSDGLSWSRFGRS